LGLSVITVVELFVEAPTTTTTTVIIIIISLIIVEQLLQLRRV